MKITIIPHGGKFGVFDGDEQIGYFSNEQYAILFMQAVKSTDALPGDRSEMTEEELSEWIDGLKAKYPKTSK